MTFGQMNEMTVASRRERERQQRREQIVDAAEKVFFAKGFSATTMEQVAAEAELSKGTLYLYFKNKDDLFIALSVRFLRALAERFEDIVGASGTGLQMVETMMRTYADAVRDRPRHFRNFAESLATGYAMDISVPGFLEHQRLAGKLIGILVSALVRGTQDSSIRSDIDPAQTASQVWGGLFGILLLDINREELLRRSGQSLDFSALVPSYIELLCGGLRAKQSDQTNGDLTQRTAG